MTWLGRLNPTPTFPAHTGPYKVGSVDVEIPTSQLDSPSADAPPKDIPTVAFRLFYPCTQESEQKGVKWLPSPQREYIGAYARFLGANSAFAGVFAALPQLLYYITMPVHQNATLLNTQTKSKRWPVMIFSHGLGGSRNAYSHICGSLASHGVVVVAPDHRDGSSPLSILHVPHEKEKIKRVEYRSIAHKPSTEVYEARDEQLAIRLWELGMIHDALLKIDQGANLKNVVPEHSRSKDNNILRMFQNTLNIYEPGSITLGGHSFGACTMIQFVKSVYYNIQSRTTFATTSYKPLYVTSPTSQLARQITPATPVILLDLWTLPLQSPTTSWLRDQPMPSYDPSSTSGKNASVTNILAILSEGFFNWSANLAETKRVISPPPPPAIADRSMQQGPHIFYPLHSAHLSQSDFGVLFPWLTTRVFGAREPERVLKLNARAMLQVLRNSGIEVAPTSHADMEIAEPAEEQTGKTEATAQDAAILSTHAESVRGWIHVGLDTANVEGVNARTVPRVEGKSLVGTPMEKIGSDEVVGEKVGKGPGEAVVEGEALGLVVEGERR